MARRAMAAWLVGTTVAHATAFSSMISPSLQRSHIPSCRAMPVLRAGPHLRMQASSEPEGGSDTDVPMQQYAINLEGHFKSKVGFMPHMFRVDGDFATGAPLSDLWRSYTRGTPNMLSAAENVASAVPICR